MKCWRSVLTAGVVLGLTACSGSEPDSAGTTPAPRTPAADGVEMVPDQVIGDGITTADVYRPVSGDGLPVVVMLHGTAGDRTEFDGLAREVATSGAVVYVPTWPVIAATPDEEEVGELWRRQTEAVVCSLRHARATAADLGGDPDDLTVVGHSGGATVGARVALVADPPWPGIDCYPGVPHAPNRFISTGADFTGSYSYASSFPEQYRPYDVFGLTPANPVEVRMYQGFNDWNVNSATETTAFDEHLGGAGLDSQAAYLDSAHGDLIDVTELFWMVGFEEGFDVIDSGFLDIPPGPVDDPPEGVETGRQISVEAGAAGLLRWVFVRGTQQWVPTCCPDVGTTDPDAGLMHSAPVVTAMQP